jgi:uncharacterized RDD family membrane protein YckC
MAFETVTPDPVASCPRCSTPNAQGGLFCLRCNLYLRDESQSVERASYARRILGSYLLEQVLFWLLLIVGWFIWHAFAARRGRSPAKSLTSLYVIDIETGRAAGGGEMWIREFAIKGLGYFFIAYLLPMVFLADAFWMFFDRDRQTLHDKALKQVVVYAPRGLPESMLGQPNAPRLHLVSYEAPWQAKPPPAQPTSVRSGAEELRELQRLKAEGLITDEEYERKRAALVERM